MGNWGSSQLSCRVISGRVLLPSPIFTCIWLQLLGACLSGLLIAFFWIYSSSKQLFLWVRPSFSHLLYLWFPAVHPLLPSPFLTLTHPTSSPCLWHLVQRCCYTVDSSFKPWGPSEFVYVSRNFQSRTFGPAFDLGASNPARTSWNMSKTKDIVFKMYLV